MGPNFLPDPIMRRHQSGRPSTQRIRNEMDDSIPNKPKKCSYCRTEDHKEAIVRTDKLNNKIQFKFDY